MASSPASTPHPVQTPERAPGAPALPLANPPLLLLFSSKRSGQARRVEGYIAHVLQRRHNHESFRFRIVDEEERPDLFERLQVTQVPSVLVVDDRRVCRRLEGYVRPHEVEEALAPWLH